MKALFLSISLFLSPLGVWAQWTQDFESAKAAAIEEEKIIFAFFTGSDWCPPCMQVERSVFSNMSFFKKAADQAIFFKADFPRKRPQPESLQQQNNELARKYGVRSFPTMLILKADGTKLKKVGGARTEANILKQIEAAHGSRNRLSLITLVLGSVFILFMLFSLGSFLLLRWRSGGSNGSNGFKPATLEIPDPEHYLVQIGHSAPASFQIQSGKIIVDELGFSLDGARFISEDILQLTTGTQLTFVPGP